MARGRGHAGLRAGAGLRGAGAFGHPSAPAPTAPDPTPSPLDGLSPDWVVEDDAVRPLGVPGLEASEAGFLASTEALTRFAKRGITDHRRPSAREYWRSNLVLLGSILSEPLEAALKAGDWPLTRRIVAEYHLKVGDDPAARAAMDASDEAVAAAAVVFRTIAWGQMSTRDRGFDEVELFSPHLMNEKRTFFGRLGEMDVLLGCMRTDLAIEEELRVVYASEEGGRLRDVTVQHERQMGRAFRATTLLDSREAPEGRQLRLKASSKGVRAFCERYGDQPGFRGVRPKLIQAWSDGGSARLTLYACAGADMDIDGVPTRVELIERIGEARSTSAKTLNDWVQAHLQESDLDEKWLRRDNVLAPQGSALGLEGIDPQDLAPQRRSLTDEEALGAVACLHRRSRWVEDETAMVMRLVCDDCYSGAVAEVPLHRLEGSHPSRMSLDERRYLAAREARAALFDEPGDEGLSVAQLTSRDGTLRLRAADYAIGADPPARPSIGSVASAMNRR